MLWYSVLNPIRFIGAKTERQMVLDSGEAAEPTAGNGINHEN
jgi:hypothetical protein